MLYITFGPWFLLVCEQVDSLQYATLATVSRCGMVWFSASEEGGINSDTSPNPGTVTNDMLLRHKVGHGYCVPGRFQAFGNATCSFDAPCLCLENAALHTVLSGLVCVLLPWVFAAAL